ncbi:maleylacetoacetate isomerase [Shewanella surugensis]|uniref:Maleylacetoacetate isomerase n=1 Tax=Shewanella surugensis TaxID=212020 RepID=A0ABT0LIW3_9GAMM|nr:maleylacetoacetate isomerase [Shewanella surugensis]MCL1127631.1 maleylacetoacetate isomerase [Shewanella surugensis]
MNKLYGYWRSSAAYRVRIALNLKKITAQQLSVHLVKEGGEQHKATYLALNPQGLVPSFVIEAQTNVDDNVVLTQSIAILEYLDEVYPQVALLPVSSIDRAKVRAMAMSIACDIHPINNLRVLQYLTQHLGLDDEGKKNWYQHWIKQGFSALEEQLENGVGQYCFGNDVTLADLCLIPQVYNAERFNVDLSLYPNIERVNRACLKLDAFIDAAPENQPDAS